MQVGNTEGKWFSSAGLQKRATEVIPLRGRRGEERVGPYDCC